MTLGDWRRRAFRLDERLRTTDLSRAACSSTALPKTTLGRPPGRPPGVRRSTGGTSTLGGSGKLRRGDPVELRAAALTSDTANRIRLGLQQARQKLLASRRQLLMAMPALRRRTPN